MITSPYATQYTREQVEGKTSPSRNMDNRKPRTTGNKPRGYITPAHTNPALDVRVRDWESTTKAVRNPAAYKKPGSMQGW